MLRFDKVLFNFWITTGVEEIILFTVGFCKHLLDFIRF